MRDKAVRLFKRALIQQQSNPLPRAQLAFLMLFGSPFGAATFLRQPVAPLQLIQNMLFHARRIIAVGVAPAGVIPSLASDGLAAALAIRRGARADYHGRR
jgi:hypothetical protein